MQKEQPKSMVMSDPKVIVALDFANPMHALALAVALAAGGPEDVGGPATESLYNLHENLTGASVLGDGDQAIPLVPHHESFVVLTSRRAAHVAHRGGRRVPVGPTTRAATPCEVEVLVVEEQPLVEEADVV